MWCAAASCSFVSYVLFEDHWLMKHSAHPRPRVHHKPRWLLQRSPARCCWRRHPTIAVSPACCRAADHRHPTLWAHHTDTAWHSPLAADNRAHHLQNCDVRLFTRPMSELLWWCVHSCTQYTPLLLVRDCNQPTTVTSSSHAHGPLGLAAAVSACADQRFGTNLHSICEAQTLGNSLNVDLRAGYLSVCMTGGAASNRHWLKVRLTNGLSYLLTYLLTYLCDAYV